MTTPGKDIADNDITIPTRTDDNAANHMPENIPFGRDMLSGLRFVQWNTCSIFRKIDELIMSGSPGLDFKEKSLVNQTDYQGIKFSKPSTNLVIHKITNLM